MSAHRPLIRQMREFEHIPKNLKQVSDRICEKTDSKTGKIPAQTSATLIHKGGASQGWQRRVVFGS